MKDRKGNPVNVGSIITMTLWHTAGGWAEKMVEECEVLKIDGKHFDAKVISTGYINKNIPEKSIKRVVR